MRNPFLPLLLLGLLTGCALHPRLAQPDGRSQLGLAPVPVATLPGWTTDHPSRLVSPLLLDCTRLGLLPQDQVLGGRGLAARLGGKAGDWAGVCAKARALPEGDDAAARGFFDRNFQAYAVSDRGRSQVLFTGYYEPEVRGSRDRGGIYQTPLLRRPDDLVQVDLGPFAPDLEGRHTAGRVRDGRLIPYPSRAQIEAGALDGQGLEIAWLADPIDLFFLQMQGAGRVRLPDGDVIRVAYAGQNGQPYVAIGKLLSEQRQIPADQISAQTIRAWLVAHPAQAKRLMDENPDYVFFREVPDLRPSEGPPGTLGVALTPGRSVAVDRDFVPLGTPVWIDTTDPLSSRPLQRLVLAEDLGGAIIGPLRTDIFFGWGDKAEQRAGRAHQKGREYLLLPRPTAQAAPATQAAPTSPAAAATAAAAKHP